MKKELHEIKLDENWITPAALADELQVARSAVTNWIKRNQIDYIELPGAMVRRHLVDRRTVPFFSGKGRPRNNSEKS